MPGAGLARPARVLRLVLAVVLVTAASARASTTGSVGMSVDISPLVVVLEVSPSSGVVGRNVRARATVTNLGGSAVGPVVVELRYEPVGLDVKATGSTELRRLAAGRSGTVAWQVRGLAPGAYVVLARATVVPFATESRAVVLVIVPAR